MSISVLKLIWGVWVRLCFMSSCEHDIGQRRRIHRRCSTSLSRSSSLYLSFGVVLLLMASWINRWHHGSCSREGLRHRGCHCREDSGHLGTLGWWGPWETMVAMVLGARSCWGLCRPNASFYMAFLWPGATTMGSVPPPRVKIVHELLLGAYLQLSFVMSLRTHPNILQFVLCFLSLTFYVPPFGKFTHQD